ncbi:PREDICTED: testis-expressed sequence 12 protein [Eurypyga helias]|uniref:testis-expressed sequence 12 protein n=1 Tax=Eurypyga helias TaxID=54383 RepID=UPI000528734C|nr:PREDICTED: testis-expressed sequence 12 protein [Eurypyga helias]
MTSNTQKPDENRSKRKKEMENEASENPQLSSLDKTDLACSEGSQSLCKPEPLEKVLNEMNKEIKNLLSKYAHILSERAAMDASYVQELDGILKEARTIENHLKQKRESLKQRFTVIANTLQS